MWKTLDILAKMRSSSATPSLESSENQLKWSNKHAEQALDAIKKRCSERRTAADYIMGFAYKITSS